MCLSRSNALSDWIICNKRENKKILFSVDFYELPNDDIVEFHNKSLPKKTQTLMLTQNKGALNHKIFLVKAKTEMHLD